jgi:hypothetical protein
VPQGGCRGSQNCPASWVWSSPSSSLSPATSATLLPIRSARIGSLLVAGALPSGRLRQRGEWRASSDAVPHLLGASPTVLWCSIGWPPMRAVASLLSWSSMTCRRRAGASNKCRRSWPWWLGPLLLVTLDRPWWRGRVRVAARGVAPTLLADRGGEGE